MFTKCLIWMHWEHRDSEDTVPDLEESISYCMVGLVFFKPPWFTSYKNAGSAEFLLSGPLSSCALNSFCFSTFFTYTFFCIFQPLKSKEQKIFSLSYSILI